MSNQEAIALLRNLEDSLDSYCELNEEGKTAFRMAITALELFGNSEQLPSAQPEERKKGAWILGFDNQYLEKYYYCSNCGCRKYTEDEPSDYFCSKCGADMRGGEKE